MIFTFSEEMTGIASTDFTFTNCDKSAFSVETANTVFHQVCTPDTPGETITVGVAAGVGTDPAGNSNTAATDFTFTYDTTVPTVTSIAVTGVTSGQYGTAATYAVIVTASEQLENQPTLSLAGGSVGLSLIHI